MPVSTRVCVPALLLGLAAFVPIARADSLSIGSSPPGASVEIDGVAVGVTPCVLHYPGGYFHKTKSVFGQKLEHAMTLRLSKEGFASKEIQLAEGPFDWVNFAGHDRGHYYLLKTNKLAVVLEADSPSDSRRVKSDPSEAGNEAGKVKYHVEESPAESSISTDLPHGGFVEVVSDPPGADIFVDRKFAGETPSKIHVESGTHRLRVRLRGHHSWERDLYVNSGSEVSLHADLIDNKSGSDPPDDSNDPNDPNE